MQVKVNLKFKQLRKVEAGSFTDDNGQFHEYNSSYRLVCDDCSSDVIQEVVFKVKENNTILLNTLRDLDSYTDIVLLVDLRFYKNNVIITPLSVVQ